MLRCIPWTKPSSIASSSKRPLLVRPGWQSTIGCAVPPRRGSARPQAAFGNTPESPLSQDSIMEVSRSAGSEQLPRVLGPWMATALIIGTVIGSGVFKKPYAVARDLDEFGLIMLAWVLVGILAF